MFSNINSNMHEMLLFRSSRPEGLRPANFIKKEALAQVFSGEYCEISKNTSFYRTPPAAASGCHINILKSFSKTYQRVCQTCLEQDKHFLSKVSSISYFNIATFSVKGCRQTHSEYSFFL